MKNHFQHHIVCFNWRSIVLYFPMFNDQQFDLWSFFVITFVSYFKMENATSLLIFNFWNLFNGLRRAQFKQHFYLKFYSKNLRQNAKFLFPNKFSLWELTWRCWDSFPFIFLHWCECVWVLWHFPNQGLFIKKIGLKSLVKIFSFLNNCFWTYILENFQKLLLL